MFNISTINELEKAFEIYKSHLAEEHHLPLNKKTKAQNKFAKFLGYENYSVAVEMVQRIEMNQLAIKEKTFQEEIPKMQQKISDKIENTYGYQDLNVRNYKISEIGTVMRTDDGAHTVEFDSSPVFLEAFVKGEEELVKLVKNLKEDDFGSGYNTDELALYFSSYEGNVEDYIRIKEAFAHNEQLPESVEDRGFNVTVDECDILKWCKKYCSSKTVAKISEIINCD